MYVTCLILFGWLSAVVGVVAVARWSLRLDRARKRLFTETGGGGASRGSGTGGEPRFLSRWLYLAGYRSQSASATFVGLTAGLFLAGSAAAYVITTSGITDRELAMISAFPGGVLDVFAPLVYAAPWLAFAFLVGLPYLAVRRARRIRVGEIEQDMPITLELLSTLAESGLSFDPALDRVLESQPANRPLTVELRTFRAETLSGRPRVHCFRRLARRIDVTTFSTFVSAVVQAEQVGAGVATVLRQQADDVRARRREKALELAMSLPVKRLIPLAVCFMPGIFFWALGPSFFELIRFVDLFTRNRGLR